MAGTYTWVAVYSGDTNNVGTDSGCGAEDVAIAKNEPAIFTTPSLVPNDSIDVSSLTTDATGTLYVELQVDAACDDPDPLYSKTWDDGLGSNEAFTGNGVYTTDNTEVVDEDAIIRWCVTYSGDANNEAFGPSDEGEVIDINFDAEALAGAFGLAIPLLLWGLWIRRRREGIA
jgi:hypothetical protein